MKITKMQGAGNDYLYFFEEPPADVKERSIRLCDRHFGIGADGLIYISESAAADFRMRIFNADGSEAGMCGNGIRCVAKYVYARGYTDQTELRIETQSGIREVKLHRKGAEVTAVSVNMGKVTVSKPVTAKIGGISYLIHPVSVGNPHAVIITDQSGLGLPERIGSEIEHHPMFPGGVNAEFVTVLSENRIRMRVWERGSGVTLACGTGACASAAVCTAEGLCAGGQPVIAELDGGELELTVQEDGTVWMKGPAEFVFEAEVQMEGEDGWRQ